MKLNLFLDPLTRAEKILNIEIEIEEHRDVLEEIKLKKMSIDDEKGIEENYYYYDISYEKNDRMVKDYTFNSQKYKQHIMTAEFFANTMHKVCFDPIESNIHCELLDEQEEFFNIMKLKIQEERQRMFSDGNKIGRTFILFITKIIYSYLDYIHKTKSSYKLETFFDILDDMKSIIYRIS